MTDPRSAEFGRAARALLDAHEASEIVRRYQQGFGRPIISAEMDDFRIIAVGKTIKWSKQWRFFTDFLLDHLKDTIGRPWAVQAQREGKDHPLFLWLGTMNEVAAKLRSSSRTVFESQCKGHLGALWRLGYALYLIEHNDVLDPKVIRRLRAPNSFPATYHETQIAAAFAVAGFGIKMAEIRRSAFATPEFWATSSSGKRYSVEAKCKSGWNNAIEVSSQSFQNELRQWIRNQLYASSKKKLENSVFCFELSIPSDLSDVDWRKISELINEYVSEAADIQVKGQAPQPAYVIITNNVDVLVDQQFNVNRMAMLTGYCMPNWFVNGMEVELELAFDSRDAHRDIHGVFDCLQEIDEIPQSFDGVPRYLDPEGNEIPVQVRVGSRIEYPDAEGALRVGLVYDICTTGSEAMACVEADGEHHIVGVPLLPHEIAMAKKYGDAVFGKPEKKKKDLQDDPLKFYDWILSVYKTYDRKALLIQIGGHPKLEDYAKLPLDDLRNRAAREVTRRVIAMANRKKKEPADAGSD